MGGMGDMGGMPGSGAPNIPPEMLSKIMSDPSLMAAMTNPKVMAALQECMTNPAAFAKYSDDPEIMGLVTKLGGLMGGIGGAGGNPFDRGQGPSASGFEDVTDDVQSASVEDVD